MTTRYKVLGEKGRAHHGGTGTWPLPTGKRPGKWLEVQGRLEPCKRGLHLCRRTDLVHWLGPTIWIAEADETELLTQRDKVVVRRARLITRLETWNDATARLFAADCAKDAVRRCRKAGITVDKRVDECIRVVYRYARGEATEAERSAAGSAAYSAAGSAAPQTKRLFEYLDGKRT